MMRRLGHPIFGAIVGFFLFFFIGIDLLLFGAIRTYSNLITILPLVGIVVGFLWGWWSPFRRKKLAAAKRAAMPAPAQEPASVPAPAQEAAPVPATMAEPEHMESPTRTTDGNEPPPLS